MQFLDKNICVIQKNVVPLRRLNDKQLWKSLEEVQKNSD